MPAVLVEFIQCASGKQTPTEQIDWNRLVREWNETLFVSKYRYGPRMLKALQQQLSYISVSVFCLREAVHCCVVVASGASGESVLIQQQ